MKQIRRYINLFFVIVKISFAKATAFRFDFWCRIFMDLVFYAVSIAGLKLLYLHTGDLGGWNESQALVFLSGYLLLDALQMTFISHNLWQFPSDVNTGQFDYVLVRPVSSLFWISLKEISVSSVVNLICALAVFIWSLSNFDAIESVWQYVLFFLFLINGLFLFFLVRILFSMPVFWLHSPYTFERIFYSLQPFLERPHQIFKGWIKFVVMTILPFALMASVPAHFLFNESSFMMVLQTVAVTTGFATFVFWLWNRALGSYSSASS